MEILRRIIDVVAASAGLLVLSPALVALAIAVRITSPGPALYRGVRTGRHGEPFRICKFRSMTVGGESLGGTTTGAADPRLTPIGRFIRKHKLDELPQLLNVLWGDMSLVGPRPEVAEYTSRYTERERTILSVKPGITDLASLEFVDLQAVVGAEDPDAAYRRHVLPRKNELRVRYVETRTLGGDAAILVRTVAKVLGLGFGLGPARDATAVAPNSKSAPKPAQRRAA
ncbi:MAG: sugar transferase [Planctomycetota bacterium]